MSTARKANGRVITIWARRNPRNEPRRLNWRNASRRATPVAVNGTISGRVRRNWYALDPLHLCHQVTLSAPAKARATLMTIADAASSKLVMADFSQRPSSRIAAYHSRLKPLGGKASDRAELKEAAATITKGASMNAKRHQTLIRRKRFFLSILLHLPGDAPLAPPVHQECGGHD